MVEANRPYPEWTRDVDDYPSEAACSEAREKQAAAVEFHWRGFECPGRFSDSRLCVSKETLGAVLPRKEAQPEKVDVWLRP